MMKRLLALLPHDDIDFHDSVYMRRHHLLRTRFLSLRVHHILRPDSTTDVHDHPWHFISLVLHGRYRERFLDGTTAWRHRWSVAFKRAGTAHTIDIVSGDVWTLVLCGPILGDGAWGFFVDGKWEDRKSYIGREA